MSLHSNLAGRLSVGGGQGSQRWKGGGSGREGLGMQKRVGQRSTGVRQALAQRLGVPSTESTGSKLSVGIKARLGNVRRGQGASVMAGHTWQKEEEYNSPYPATNERRDTVAAERQQQRRKARSIAVTARRGIQESGTQPPSSPVMVKMASGKLVGGMRSDQIRKGPQSSPPNTRVAMDASRGLTVSVPNKLRPPPLSRFGSRTGDASRQEQWSSGRGNMYSEHDDRAGPANRRGGAGADLHSDWDYSEEDVGLELRSRRRHDSDSMEVDSNAGGDVYNASLQFTRTTTHHHHHHHHGPSPPPQPPLFAVYGGGYRCEGSPPPQKVLYRRASPRRGGRYEDAPPHNYSPPPPPSPPSFHPRYRYAPPLASPSPSPPPKGRQQFIEVVKNKTNKSRVPAKAHSYKAALKTARLVKRGKIIKPAKKVKKLKATLKGSAIKARQGKIKKKKKKLHSTTHASSPDSVSSDSDQDSSSSSSSGSSSSESSYSERSHQVVYKPPVERVLPEPHKQVLDQQVRACIAALQGKEPDYTSGPGPGVKNLVFVPTMTTKPLHQRFTVDSGR